MIWPPFPRLTELKTCVRAKLRRGYFARRFGLEGARHLRTSEPLLANPQYPGGLKRQYQTVRPARWRLLHGLVDRVVLALRGFPFTFVPIGRGGIWRSSRAATSPAASNAGGPPHRAVADLPARLAEVREESFHRAATVFAQLDRELGERGEVAATAVLRPDPSLGASFLAAAFRWDPASQASSEIPGRETYLWCRLPQVDPWRLQTNPTSGLLKAIGEQTLEQRPAYAPGGRALLDDRGVFINVVADR